MTTTMNPIKQQQNKEISLTDTNNKLGVRDDQLVLDSKLDLVIKMNKHL
jgi:hypothetical protein